MGASGLIPAHAGKTECFPHGMSAPRAHPHSRGENEAGDEKGSTFEGSSPLTRGKHTGMRATRVKNRLIPAHAGKTRRRREWLRRSEAHPRSRGENGAIQSTVIWESGSSPLTRGKPSASTRRRCQGGLIPAHAGKTTG